MTEAEYQFKMDTFGEFLALGPRVWKNWDFVKGRVFLGMQDPPKKVYAAVLCHVPKTRKQQAIGRSILQAADRYDLLLSASRLMKVTAEQREKVLLHELVHLGYSGHGKDFRKVCMEVGGVISGAAVTDPGFHMEKKVGHRYKRIMTFDTEAAAKAWFESPVEVATRDMERYVYFSEFLKQGMRADDAKKAAYKMVRWAMVYG